MVGRADAPGGGRGAKEPVEGVAASPERDMCSAPFGRGALPNVQLKVCLLYTSDAADEA